METISKIDSRNSIEIKTKHHLDFVNPIAD